MGTRKEVIEIMDKMMLNIDKSKITLALLLTSFGLGVAVFLLFWPKLIPGLIFGSVITVYGWILPKKIMNNIWEKRCNKVVDQMVDGLTIMSNGIKAGLSVAQTMERVILNMKGPLPDEFKLILNKMKLGMTLEDALVEFDNRIQRQDVQMLVTAVNILKETGGNLGETFETIVATIRERQKINKKIEAMTAQGVMQGFIMTSVPFVLLGVFLLIDPNYVMPLFTHFLGWISLGIMIFLQVLGGYMIKKIITVDV